MKYFKNQINFKMIPNIVVYLLERFVTCNSSSVQAQEYVDTVHRPLPSKLTPLRLSYYAYLLFLAFRMTLYSVFQEKYTQYDLTMAILNAVTIHHMSGLCLTPYGMLGFYFDYILCIRPHRKVAPVLNDLLVLNKGKKTI